MVNPPSSDGDAPGLSRLRAANTVMALAILVLLGLVAWQLMRIGTLEAGLEQSRRELAASVEKLAMEKVQANRAAMVNAVAFVDELYRSADGLQRPDGLYLRDARKVDAEAIGTWVLDVYLRARIEGMSDEDALQAIATAVKRSDEWRRKHPQ
jgi:hypothetical protein